MVISKEALFVASATEVAVMVAEPGAMPVTTPASTVAIDSSELAQVTEVSLALVTEAVKEIVLPITTVVLPVRVMPTSWLEELLDAEEEPEDEPLLDDVPVDEVVALEAAELEEVAPDLDEPEDVAVD
jgi:hypothetical protein